MEIVPLKHNCALVYPDGATAVAGLMFSHGGVVLQLRCCAGAGQRDHHVVGTF